MMEHDAYVSNADSNADALLITFVHHISAFVHSSLCEFDLFEPSPENLFLHAVP
jgi:hypothetical protein